MIATIYRQDTGVIRAIVDTPDLATVLLNVGDGEAVIEGRFDPETTYITAGIATAYPPKPGPWAVWNGARWIDSRSIAQAAAQLEAHRDAASLSKADLLTGLMELGVIGMDDAREAARTNTIPAAIAGVMTGLDLVKEEIAWATGDRINRNQAIVVTAITELDLDPAEIDRLFAVPEN